MTEIEKYKILMNTSIRDVVKRMDELDSGFCVCIDDNDQVSGVISDGDFRHAVHNGIQLDENIRKIINRKFYSVQKNYDPDEVERIFNNTIVRKIPVLENGKLVDVITLEDFYGKGNGNKRGELHSPVVIMAGGEGTRLDPFTRILPKPLIPLGNEPVIKVIMDEFNKFGMNDFHISIRDKGRMIRAYFHDHNLGYHIDYIHEDKPLGTIGALKQLEGKIGEPFFVSNCDTIVRTDYAAFYDFHKENGYSLTMVGSMQQHTIPYGVCEVDNGGALKGIQEKPKYDFLVNTGMYLLDPDVLKFIPDDTFFNMTDLIQKVKDGGLNVGVFPVSEKSWIDVGQLSEYKDIISRLSL